MHQSSYLKMKCFVNDYLNEYKDKNICILDIGSCDVNGSYKPLFDEKTWKYTGADIEKGKNVDIVINDLYNWKEFKSNSFDVIISGQVFEHIEYFWITMLEIKRVLKNNGFCCIIAPSNGYEHKYPIDCWRYYPDGFKSLAKFADLKILDAYADFEPDKYEDDSHLWKDCVLICKNEKKSILNKMKFRLKSKLSRIVMRL